MDEQTVAAWMKAQEAIDEVDELLARRRSEGAGGAQWQPPAPEAPQPITRAPAPRQRPAPAPPTATKLMRTVHDGSGRISSIEHFEGDAAASARSWEQWILRAIDHRLGDATRKHVLGVLEGFGGAVGDVLREEREATGKVIADLQRRVAELEQRAGVRQPREELFDVAAE